MNTEQSLCKCISRPNLEYMTPSEIYEYTVCDDGSVAYHKTDGSGAGSFGACLG